MKISNRAARIYSAIYTVIMLAIGILSANKYVFVPNVPYLYVMLIPLFVVQMHLFRRQNSDKAMATIFLLNLFVSLLFVNTSAIIGTQYFAIFHLLTLAVSARKYARGVLLLLFDFVVSIVYLICVALTNGTSLFYEVMVRTISISISLILLICPYPKIGLDRDMIKFGAERYSVFDDDFFKVESSIKVVIGHFVKPGAFIEDIG